MTQSIATVTLAEFLARSDIESSPAWELIRGRAVQKPMPTLFHSRLQRNLMNYINDRAKGFEAIQELRCVVPPQSPVPDISVIAEDRFSDDYGAFEGAPDWLIEILSPGQGTLELQNNLKNKTLHCLGAETRLAWLIDGDRQQIWVWAADGLPIVYSGTDALPDLGMGLGLTVDRVAALARQRS
ncbi:MAG: Uma2 family endonuclease [Geitlerinemataceae cyanobacterium]